MMLSLSHISQDIFTTGIKIKKDVLMKHHTSFKVGGPADYFARPYSVRDLVQLIGVIGNISHRRDIGSADENRTPCTIIGGGTNILVKDRGIRGLVISLSYMKNEIDIEEIGSEQVKVSVSAGTSLSVFCRKTIKLGLEDLSFAAGIPGTVGGAVMMNAGTGVGTISERLVSIDILDRDNSIRTIDKSQLIFSYRKLEFPKSSDSFFLPLKPIILRASFLLTRGSREKVEQSWRALIEKRKASQPYGFPSAGCFFKNPGTGNSKANSTYKLMKPADQIIKSDDQSIISAGQLIDMAGLKKKRVGDAMVSDKHANFILNLGNATANEILILKNIVKETVFEKFGVHLSEEVIIQGE